MNMLEKLLYLQGVAAEYKDYGGQLREIPWHDRLKTLTALGYDTSDEKQISQAVFRLDAEPWQKWLRPVYIASLGSAEHVDVSVPPHQLDQAVKYTVYSAEQQLASSEFVPAQLAEVGEYYIDSVRYSARRLPLPAMPPGYYQIKLESDELQQGEQATLILAPERCFDTNRRSNSGTRHKLWGISCQLYTLRSSSNWGIGDFGDLRELIELSAPFGVDLIGLNPLHAPDLHGEDYASPYSPSHRHFLNPLYIDLQGLADLGECSVSQALIESRTFQHSLKQLRAAPLVDYPSVVKLKFAVFDSLYKHFLDHHLELQSERASEFLTYVEQQGQALQDFAAFESSQQKPLCEAAVQPLFHCYLQWLSAGQLAACQQLAVSCGMTIGLLGDLAVGAVAEGAEVANNATLFCTSASIGAPPDPFAAEGQNWNMPVIDPVAMRTGRYAHFIQLIQSNMSHYGALRIDHILGLMRLWWCLPGTTDGGNYVYYPFEDLLAIVRLESHLRQCVVIGEDLGVVPDDLRARMEASRVYANKILYFETDYEQQFRSPAEHQADALLMVTNHDVATLAGWWNLSDLDTQNKIGRYADEELANARAERQHAKVQLLKWLQQHGRLCDGWCPEDKSPRDILKKPFDLALCKTILCTCASSRSALLTLQIDDLQLIESAVNIPGTHKEYPNWRRKQAEATAQLFANPDIKSILSSINAARQQREVH